MDISGCISKTVDEAPLRKFDYVVTVCDSASERSPRFPAMVKVIHL